VTTLLLAHPVWLPSPEMRMRSVCRFSGFVQTPLSPAIISHLAQNAELCEDKVRTI
jgi:hypothetical protein